MRNYPATLLQVLENKLEEGYEDGEDIPFWKADLQQATEELDIEVRDVMEIASAYSSRESLPEEFTTHGVTTIEYESSDSGEDVYVFKRE